MTQKHTFISVIIPTRNEEDNIEEAIRHIYESDYNLDHLEVIVVDGFSQDNTREILFALKDKYPNLHIIDNRMKVTPAAFNLGLEHCKGKYFLTIGARHFIDKNYISECARILDENPNIACTGGISITIESSFIGSIIAKAMSLKFGVGIDNSRTSKFPGVVDTVGCPMYRKSAVTHLGSFDERLVRNQDDDLSYRLLKNKFSIYQTISTSVKYRTRNNFTDLFKQLYQYGYWKIYVNKKHRTLTTKRQVFPILFVIYSLIITHIFLYSQFSPLSLIILILASIPLIVYFIIASITSYLHSKDFVSFLLLIYCFLIMHSSYGLGYLKGIIHLLILNSEPSEKLKSITR
ncbi:MAG: glycosyltransferase family 2 protein [Bacteroidota bacterium]|jgi:glycosyltransferase involved in cell wall biosynthesis